MLLAVAGGALALLLRRVGPRGAGPRRAGGTTPVRVPARGHAQCGRAARPGAGRALAGPRPAAPPSDVDRLAADRPWLLFLAAGLLSLGIGRATWDPAVPVQADFILVQLAQWAIFAFAALAYWLPGMLLRGPRDAERMTWALTRVGVGRPSRSSPNGVDCGAPPPRPRLAAPGQPGVQWGHDLLGQL